jgi:hypothetical protein
VALGGRGDFARLLDIDGLEARESRGNILKVDNGGDIVGVVDGRKAGEEDTERRFSALDLLGSGRV